MADRADGEALEDYLDKRVFAGMAKETVAPNPADVDAFNAYIRRFEDGLPIERAAVESLKR